MFPHKVQTRQLSMEGNFSDLSIYICYFDSKLLIGKWKVSETIDER